MKKRALARSKTMRTLLQVGSYDTTDFDLQFWQSFTAEDRFKAVFDLVAHVEALKMKRGAPVRFRGVYTFFKPGQG